jgi:hypothetical protein
MDESNVIVSYIERKGWQVVRVAQGWQVRRPDERAAFYLSFTPSWTCLQAPLSFDPGAVQNAAEQVRLYRHLLSCNEEMFMGKCCCDSAGRLTLQVELPGGGSIHRIDYALDAMLRYQPMMADGVTHLEDHAAPAASDRAAKQRYFDAPPGIPHEVIAYYLRAIQPHGWGARSKPKGVTWQLGYKSQRMFEVFLTLTRSWTYFHIPVLPETPRVLKGEDHAAQSTFLDYLLQINNTWYMAKLGLNEAGQVLAMLEVPTQELDFDLFRHITRLLAAYLDLYAREIQIMAHLPSDPKLVEKIVLAPNK